MRRFRHLNSKSTLMKKNLSHCAFLFLFIMLAGCDWRSIRGNGNITTEQRPVTSFTRVKTGGGYEIRWQPGPPFFSLTTDQNLLAKIETTIDGNVLNIRAHGPLSPTHGIKVVISSDSLAGAQLSGAARFDVSGLSGAGFTLSTSGATKTTLAGKVTRLLADLTGASQLRADALQADDVELAITGTGKADVLASNSLKASITGAGKVTYGGNPQSVQKHVIGAGKIEPRQ
jgi:hypothetical protein